MRHERDLHQVEFVAIATLLAVEAREQLQRLGLGLVAAPARGEFLEALDRVLALHLADRMPQRDLAQLAARGGRTRRRLRCRVIERQRIADAADPLGDAALQHVELGRQFWRDRQRLQLVQPVGGIVEVAHLDRGAQRLLAHLALQFRRQRRDRGVERPEAVARFDPLALLRERDRAPQRRIVAIADRGLREVLLRIAARVRA